MTVSTSTTSGAKYGEAHPQRATLRGRSAAVVSGLWRGRSQDPAWERPALLLILAANALLYGWNLGINGWANSYYSAAVQAGTRDAAAFFFGSSDWGNAITVDKPPLSLWMMGLSVRIFGFNPVAMLLPQVVMGVATTLLIYGILRRYVSAAAALTGATVFFTTPIVTLMCRYNNPDPLMLLLMVAAVWFLLRSIETGHGRFFILAGALLGLAFMTKQMQGLLSVPAIGLAYLLFSPQTWPRRLGTAAAGLGVLVVTGGLWMTVVDLVPASQRPYVGGSVSNSVLELTLAYNGVDRVVGSHALPEAMQLPSQYRSVASDAGLLRLLNANYNQEASWLLYPALLALVLLFVGWNKQRGTPAARALIVVSSLWLVTAFLLLSFMGSQIHTYYTAALAPPLALVLGITLDSVIMNRKSPVMRVSGAVIALAALLSSWLILSGTAGWPSWLPMAVLGVGALAVSSLVIRPPNPRVEGIAAAVLAAALLCGPAATSVHNVTTGFSGSNPLSGVLSKNPAGISHLLESMSNNELTWGHDMAFGRMPDAEVVGALAGTKDCTWAAASYASQSAARLQLESGRPVMPLGGFAGSDPFPTLDEFKAKVADGDICYFVEQEALLKVQAADSASTAVSAWVQGHYTAEKLGGTTVYRLGRE
ncbi:MAG: glycosyl transferase family 39 [Pseudarthrobacter sp.]|nr:glycosyl transferase family 39 [Pseudarthrobacter sp.]